MDTKLDSIIDSLTANTEFEVKFNYKEKSLTLDLFQYLLKEIKNDSGEKVISTTLDINYNYLDDSFDVYRLTIDGIENINSIIKIYAMKSNNITFSLLTSKIKNYDYLTLMLKEKGKFKNVSFTDDEYNIRYRLSEETTFTEVKNKKLLNLSELEKLKISFRFKNRVSLIIHEDSNVKIVLDITSVKSNKSLLKIGTSIPNYEIELEFFKKTSKKVDKKIKEIFTKWIEKVLKWINKTEVLLGKTEKDLIINEYKKLLNREDLIKLYSMQPETLSLPQLVDRLSNNYAVTDKADGSLCNIFITNKKCYLISNILEVKVLPIKVDFKTRFLAEGELIGNDVLLFDIMFYDDQDIRKSNLNNRLAKLDEFVQKLNPKTYKFEKYDSEKYTVNDLVKFYDKELKNYVKYLNTTENIICRKYYLIVKGIDNSEIFRYATLLWNHMKDVKYKLDGLIFAGIEQFYTSYSKEIEFPTLKWKPPELNSIDMYIEFEKNSKGEIENVYDNSNPEQTKDVIFNIANLYVGRTKDNKEQPVRFMNEEGFSQAYFTLVKGQIRDEEGIIVNDKTVIELAYNPDDSILPQYRWHILRSRYDKTYNVQQHQKQYGNNEYIAKKIFQTILNPIKFDDLEQLGNNYDKYINIVKNRVSTKLIEMSKQNDAYYQFKSDLGKPMRKYHNYIKDILFNYLLPKTLKNGNKYKLSLLDIGIGRGGDILKYYHHDVKEVVGIDPDYNGLYSASDSAFSRYETQRKKKPYFPKMTFIQADGGELLNLKNQEKVFPNMSNENKEYIKKHLNRKFDSINIQFVVHYFFKDSSFDKFCENINNCLEDNGYIIITTLDAHLIKQFLDGEKEKSVYFTDENATKQTFFSIKDVSIGDKPGLGQAYDFYTAMYMNENTYQTEYLVYPELLISEFKKKCKLTLIESMTFKDLMNQQKEFFMSTIGYEKDQKRKQFFENDVKYFYTDNSSITEASKHLTYLNRYYVFQK